MYESVAELLEQCQGQQHTHTDTQDVSVEHENNYFSKKAWNVQTERGIKSVVVQGRGNGLTSAQKDSEADETNKAMCS